MVLGRDSLLPSTFLSCIALAVMATGICSASSPCDRLVASAHLSSSADSMVRWHGRVLPACTQGRRRSHSEHLFVVVASHRLASDESKAVAPDGMSTCKAMLAGVKGMWSAAESTKPAFGSRTCETVLLAQNQSARAPPAGFS